MDISKSDVFNKLPEPLKKVYREMYGVAETGASVVSGIGAPVLAGGEFIHDSLTHEDSPELKKAEEWLAKNKDLSGDPRYQKIQKWRDNEVKQRPGEASVEEDMFGYTYSPRTEEGQRNVQAIGETMEDFKIPPFVPGVGPAGRFGVKRKPSVKKVRPDNPENVETSGALFNRARVYFDEAKDARVDFNANSVGSMISTMRNSLKEAEISGVSSYGKNAQIILDKMELQAKKGQPISFNQVMEFRDLIDDIETISKPKSKRVSAILRDDLDDFVANADESVIAQTSEGGRRNIDAFKRAQKYYGTAKNTQIIEEALENAKMKTGGNYSQAQLADAMKKEIRRIVKNKKQIKFFSPEAKTIMQDFAKGEPLERFLKRLSKLDPTAGNWVIGPNTGLAVLIGSLTDSTTGAIAYGAGAGVGKTAKQARDLTMKNSINKMMANIQNRDVDVNTGFSQVDMPTDLGLLGSSVAGQNGPDEDIQSLLEQQRLPFPQGR